jgi:hypothetical protein
VPVLKWDFKDFKEMKIEKLNEKRKFVLKD